MTPLSAIEKTKSAADGVPDLLTHRQAAFALDCSLRSVRRLISAGQLRSYKTAAGRRVDRAQIAAYVRDCEMIGNVRSNVAVNALAGELEESHIVSSAMRVDACSGIYFLIQDRKIVYVGRSSMVWRRIAAHMIEKRFDSYYVLECQAADLGALERKYIAKFKPVLNIHGISKRPRDAAMASAIAS